MSPPARARAVPDAPPHDESLRRVETSRRARRAGAHDAGRDDTDWVVAEEPLEIRVGGRSFAVVMRTQGDDADLALGLVLAEGLVSRPDEVASIERCSIGRDPEHAENAVRVALREGMAADVDRVRRHLVATASCGVCGRATLDDVLASAPPLDDALRLPASFFFDLPERLRAQQARFERTGGLHAAALVSPDGRFLDVREDVGRHNAVDKVVGGAARAGTWPLAGHVLLVSGRVSFEIAQKAVAARIPIVAAVSAPSSLAIELAARARLAIVGFLRDGRCNVYGHRERVT